MKQMIKRLLPVLLAVLLLAGCGNTVQKSAEGKPSEENISRTVADAGAVPSGVDIMKEPTALASEPAVAVTLEPEASGKLVKKNAKAVIDYSNTVDGYVMVKYTAQTEKELKAQVKGPSGTVYTYNVNADGNWVTFPLSDGNGSYKVTVYENISGTKYATVISVSFDAGMKDEFAPFLLPNQYVNYTPDSNTVAKAAELTEGMTMPLDKVQAIYDFVVTNLTYDDEKAETVQCGYLPVLDDVLASGKGICFDYAALMAAMLRSQNVPTKLVVGYAGTAYHAWINVYSQEDGWIDGAIYFDGTSWKLMDPTFASSANRSAEIMQYIGDGANYTAKYIY